MFKLVSLRASGFKRLDIEEKLEFPDGRLLVHGRNESGKSTLMEAIHYALYGMPLRPSKNAGNEDIICYGRDTAIVELEFSIDDVHYHVRRELHRKKTNIHLLNKRGQGNLSRVTTGARNVNRELEEILHGIDSDALLNSCLVEQKELGKLEDANKQERIRAMSSLLNLEAFVDARNSLKKEGNDLEKTHLMTLNQLAEAEKAKKEYEEAQERRESAEKRLAEIIVEKKTVEERLEELRRSLEVIKQMKAHQQNINENTTKRKGKQDEINILRDQLEDIEQAEKELEGVLERLPVAEKHLRELDERVEMVLQLIEHNDKITRAESNIEKIEIRLSETKRNYDEAKEAGKKIEEIDTKITEYLPVKQAAQMIEEIAGLINKLNASVNEETRLDKELEAAHMTLDGSSDSGEKIKQLEDREKDANELRAQTQKMRTIGSVATGVGLIIAAIMVAYSNMTIAGLGVVILVAGVYLVLSNNPGSLESEINEIRVQREAMLGERARIRDYQKTIERIEAEKNTIKTAQLTLEIQIIQELNQLPEKPQEYKTTISLTEPESINKLRAQIQEDTQTLTRYTTEKESLQKKAESLEMVKKTLDSIQKEKKEQEKIAEKLREQIEKAEQDTGIKREDEPEIRKQHTEANNQLTELNTQKNSIQKTLERRPQIQEAINEATNEINLLTATIQQEEKKFNTLMEQGVDLSDEPRLDRERDENLRKSASLEREEQERSNDIEESDKIIQEREERKEEYPALVETSEREEFSIEAIRRAQILLDTTRESIMAGVKQNVEKNMMQFLPTLTDNRYNMARIDETNYRIEVYDREAKTWRGKGVFSGATQDQFSLALRLAFAISTIPSSRGARPGFIFLDEPLSGFDAQRRNGFMQLLREDLSRHFDQIIVISHLEALADEFQNRLTLESGKIIEVQR